MSEIYPEETGAVYRCQSSHRRPESVVSAPYACVGLEPPNPSWVRGNCPDCGEPVISNLYFVSGRGYLVRWDCWASLQERPTCAYSREP